MTATDDPARAHRRVRFLRHDAWRYVRPKMSGDGRRHQAFAATVGCATVAAEIASIRLNLATLRFGLAAIAARKYDPDQPRIPAGEPGGGQGTDGGGSRYAILHTDGGNYNVEFPPSAQSATSSNSTLFLDLLRAGGENVGSFGDRVSIAKGPGISHEESSDSGSGLTILSFTGIGSVVIDGRDKTTVFGRKYEVGTTDRPDLGLSVVIDRNGIAQAFTTFKS